MELYAEAFESVDALDKLEAFASFYGADFYQLPRNTEQITLLKTTWRIPDQVPFIESELVPLRAGEEITWQMAWSEINFKIKREKARIYKNNDWKNCKLFKNKTWQWLNYKTVIIFL